MTEPINTKKAERRELQFASFDELSSELNRIEAANNAGTLTTTGNWSPGQILQHCSILMRSAIDGFPPGKLPLLARLFFRLVIKRLALKGGPPPAGIKLPDKASFLIPPDDTSFEAGLETLRCVIARVTTGGERFTHPSPIFGPLTHEQWTMLQLGHCSLHLGFLEMVDAGA